MKKLLSHFHARPRLFLSLAAGLVAGFLSPAVYAPVTRGLIGWNVGVWLYLLLIWQTMWQADHGHLRRVAQGQAQGAAIVLGTVIAAVAASLVAILAELSGAKASGGLALPHVLFAISTVAASWLLLPSLFALNYAGLYYRSTQGPGSGLLFPGAEPTFQPDYWDFMYFSVTIAVASQTADVSIQSPRMRRLVLLHELLSFAFNTSILALAINIAASLI